MNDFYLTSNLLLLGDSRNSELNRRRKAIPKRKSDLRTAISATIGSLCAVACAVAISFRHFVLYDPKRLDESLHRQLNLL